MARLRPDALDDVIHGRIRLGVMAYLAQQPRASFAELARALETTNGNLSIHLKKLESAGYVEIDKRFVKGKPLTRASMTPAGQAAWRSYLDTLAILFRDSG
ncbi:transcriptional regulator [Alkalicaulis satelles]|uniref:Transcriptional regulator n=1 Tax=Alkalicaulis satelles TaxID=2609175 RepID=A0A5M6ZBN6_9PROT|nr:transcriptional regulator [Alkalicaulis satelles]KAA5801560.1 transcriptional regulator [Alkalicaulis satelles]